MRAAFRIRRVVGLLTVAAVGSSTVVLDSSGVAHAAPSELTFASAAGQVTTVTVPAGTCAVDWTISGGRGGAGSDGSPGGAPAGSRLRTLVAAGDTFTLAPGSAGGPAGNAPDGGTNPHGEAAWNGAAGSSTGGGGGAASVVLKNGAVYLSGSGRDGSGDAGGAGGSVTAAWTAERIEDPSVNPVFTLPEGESDGRIAGTGVTCGTEATQVPDHPIIVMAHSGTGQLTLSVALATDPGASRPPMPAPGPEVAAPSGWQYSLDGGRWITATSGGVPVPGTARTFTLTDLVDGQVYRVRVRATSTAGPSEASPEGVLQAWTKPGVPGDVRVQTGPGRLTLSWSPSSPGTYGLASYEAWAVSEVDPHGDAAQCVTDATARSCTIEVQGGAAYAVELYARDERMFVSDYVRTTSAVVPLSPSAATPTPVTPPAPMTPDPTPEPTATTDPIPEPTATTAPVATDPIPEPTATTAPVATDPTTTAAPAAPAVPPVGSGQVTGADGAALSTITPGETITLTGDGYAPRTRVDLYVYSTPQLLGTVVTDDAGAFAVTVTLPRGLEAGKHHLVASGLDPSGNPRYLSTEVTLDARASSSTQLAWTGVDVLPVTGAGLLALVLGAGLVVLARRRAA